MKNVEVMSTSELLVEYNKLTGKHVKRFATRASGEKQVLKAREKAIKNAVEPVAPKKKAAKAKKPKAAGGDRSKLIAETWKDPKVAKARAQRSHVVVRPHGETKGTEYRSTLAAFQDLGLPYGKHIRFRMALKSEGKKDFEHGKKLYHFALAQH